MQVRSCCAPTSSTPSGTRASSYQALRRRGTEYAYSGRLPWLALRLSVLGGHTSNAASEGCHSIAQLIMSDLQTSESMGDDILQMAAVCLRDGKEPGAVEQLELRRSTVTLTRRRTLSWTSRLRSELGELALQHPSRGTGSSSSAQHPKPNAVVESSSSSDPPSSGDDVTVELS